MIGANQLSRVRLVPGLPEQEDELAGLAGSEIGHDLDCPARIDPGPARPRERARAQGGGRGPGPIPPEERGTIRRGA